MPMSPLADRYLRLGAYFVIIGIGIKAAAGILDSLLLAAMLTVAVTPVYERVKGRGGSNGVAITATTLTLLVVVVALIGFLGLTATRLVQTVPAYEARVQEWWQVIQSQLEARGIDHSRIFSTDMVNPGRLFGVAAAFLSKVGQVFSQALLLVIIVAFILVEAGDRGHRFGSEKLLGRITKDVRQYLVLTAVFGLIFAVVVFLMLLALGVDMPMVWAVVAFIMTFIPNIGIILSIIPPALLALFEFGWQRAVVVVAGYIVLNFVIDNVIKPKFLKDSVDVSPLVGLLSLIVWSFLLGPMGALLAIPVTLALRQLMTSAGDTDPAQAPPAGSGPAKPQGEAVTA
jgi:AI-2 transport protein TqsA